MAVADIVEAMWQGNYEATLALSDSLEEDGDRDFANLVRDWAKFFLNGVDSRFFLDTVTALNIRADHYIKNSRWEMRDGNFSLKKHADFPYAAVIYIFEKGKWFLMSWSGGWREISTNCVCADVMKLWLAWRVRQ